MKLLPALCLLLQLVAEASALELRVLDQDGNPVEGCAVSYLGEPTGSSVRAAVSYMGVKVWEGLLERDQAYEVVVPISALAVEVPRGLSFRVTHLATGVTVEGASAGGPVKVGVLPHGLVEVEVKGPARLLEVVNWAGGTIRVRDDSLICKPQALGLIASALAPPCAGLAMVAARSRVNGPGRRAKAPRGPLKRAAGPQKRSAPKPPGAVERLLGEASRNPVSIAELVRRGEDWLLEG